MYCKNFPVDTKWMYYTNKTCGLPYRENSCVIDTPLTSLFHCYKNLNQDCLRKFSECYVELSGIYYNFIIGTYSNIDYKKKIEEYVSMISVNQKHDHHIVELIGLLRNHQLVEIDFMFDFLLKHTGYIVDDTTYDDEGLIIGTIDITCYCDKCNKQNVVKKKFLKLVSQYLDQKNNHWFSNMINSTFKNYCSICQSLMTNQTYDNENAILPTILMIHFPYAGIYESSVFRSSDISFFKEIKFNNIEYKLMSVIYHTQNNDITHYYSLILDNVTSNNQSRLKDKVFKYDGLIESGEYKEVKDRNIDFYKQTKVKDRKTKQYVNVTEYAAEYALYVKNEHVEFK